MPLHGIFAREEHRIDMSRHPEEGDRVAVPDLPACRASA
jgi:hypothetical protein